MISGFIDSNQDWRSGPVSRRGSVSTEGECNCRESDLKIVADEVVLYNDEIGVMPVPLPDPAFLCPACVLFYVRRSDLGG